MKKIITLALILCTSSVFASEAANVEIPGQGNCGYSKSIDEETGNTQITVHADDLRGIFKFPASILPITASTNANFADPDAIDTNVSVRYDLGFLRVNSQGHTDFLETTNLILKIDTELNQPQAFWLTYGMAGVPLAVKYCRF